MTSRTPNPKVATRTFTLPAHTLRLLTEHLNNPLPGGNEPEALIFTTPPHPYRPDTGAKPVRNNLFYRRVFKPAAKQAGLPGSLRFYDLRHTCASLTLAESKGNFFSS